MVAVFAILTGTRDNPSFCSMVDGVVSVLIHQCAVVFGDYQFSHLLKIYGGKWFFFWYALLSTITPPVCGGVFIAASMVEENWLPVAGSAMSLELGLYVIQMAVIRHPDLTSFADQPIMALLAALQVGIGLALLGRGLTAPHALPVRIALVAVGILVVLSRIGLLSV